MSPTAPQRDLESGQLATRPSADVAPPEPARSPRLVDQESDARRVQEEDRADRRVRDARRTALGYTLGAIAISSFVALGIASYLHLDQLLAPEHAALEGARFYVFVAGEAVVTMALVWFIYQLLKMAERMTLPSHYIEQSLARDPTFARSLLGVQDPAVGVKSAGEALEALAEPLAKISNSVVPLLQKR